MPRRNKPVAKSIRRDQTRFDRAATPYGGEEIGRERTLCGEGRAFTPSDEVAITDDESCRSARA